MAAISVMESDEVLLARIAPGLANLSKMVKISSFTSISSGDRLDKQVRFAAHVLHGTRSSEIGQRRFRLLWRYLSARDAIFESLPDICEALLDASPERRPRESVR